MYITLKRPYMIISDVFYLSYFNLFCSSDFSLFLILGKDKMWLSFLWWSFCILFILLRERFNCSSLTEVSSAFQLRNFALCFVFHKPVKTGGEALSCCLCKKPHIVCPNFNVVFSQKTLPMFTVKCLFILPIIIEPVVNFVVHFITFNTVEYCYCTVVLDQQCLGNYHSL